MRKLNIVLKSNQSRDEFLAWIERLVKKYGNDIADAPGLQGLQFELCNELRAGYITLAYAEEVYLRSTGITFFEATSSTDLQ
jgi:hypothetical protein